jgi:hypothetical protein
MVRKQRQQLVAKMSGVKKVLVEKDAIVVATDQGINHILSTTIRL